MSFRLLLATMLLLMVAPVAAQQGPVQSPFAGIAGTPGTAANDPAPDAPNALGIPPAPPVPSLSASSVLPNDVAAGGPPPVVVQFPPAVVTANDGTTAPLYGSSLFTGAFGGSSVGARPDYVVQPGDTINVRTYGNMSLDVVARVNADGKLFLPIVGPVTVAGVTRDRLDGVLQGAIGAVYTNTRVYAEIVQAGAIGVYVTGKVVRPGRYLGSSSDSLLYFLDKAGGIDGQRGSYRDVIVRHADGRPDEHYDLYSFLAQGAVASAKLRDGDSIIVTPRGPQVVVTGLALDPFAFELLPASRGPRGENARAGNVPDGGRQILELARPNERLVTGVYVHSIAERNKTAVYRPYADLATLPLGDGDHVDFRADTVAATISVALKARLAAPSIYVLPRGATLSDVLAQLPQDDPHVDMRSVYVLRKSVAAEQKRLIQASMVRLQADAYAATTLTTGARQAQAADAALVQRFVDAVSKVEPDGRIATYRDGRFENIRLEDGDQIVIPDRSDVVLVAGEVLNPGAFAHRGGVRIRDYIRDAGGFTVAANKTQFVLQKPNGVARVVAGNVKPEPGDQILIVPQVRGQSFQLVKDISTLLFQIALSTATVLRL